MATIAPARVPTQHLVAAGLAGAGAALLGVKAALTFGPDRYGTTEPLAGLFVVLVAGVALAAAATALRAPRVSGGLMLAAIAGALVADQLPAAPPRNLALLPLAIAAGLMLVAAGVPMHEGARSAPQPPAWATALGWLGIGLHAAVAWLYLASGLVAPGYGVVVLWALWAALLVFALRLRRNRPAWTPLVAVPAAGLWFLVMYLGEAALGWQP
ncbi:MAG: hypothetical protein ACRDSL_08410 [Pseudonocardiaceae bacterium]